MIEINQRNYFYTQFLSNPVPPPAEAVLIIRQEKKHKASENPLYFSLSCEEQEKLSTTSSKEQEVLKIPLGIECGNDLEYQMIVPLNATQEMMQLTNLLFTYYAIGENAYPVDLMVAMLVRKTLEVNTELLSTEHSYLSLLSFISNNLHRQLTINELAEAVHLTPSSLQRLCKKMSNLSPLKLFRKIQFCEAIRLLKTTSLPIQEIGQRLGFSDPAHFSKAFKKMIGAPPLEIRRFEAQLVEEEKG